MVGAVDGGGGEDLVVKTFHGVLCPGLVLFFGGGILRV
jgi:hypothetical protein